MKHFDEPLEQYEERVVDLLKGIGADSVALYAIMREHEADYIVLHSDEFKVTLEKK